MKKEHLIKLTSRKLNVCLEDSKEIIDTVLSSIVNILYSEKELYISGLGTFYFKDYPSKEIIDFSGEKVYTPKKKKIKFRVSQKLEKKLNEKINARKNREKEKQ